MALQRRSVPASQPDSAYLGLRLAFTLPTSCYATMLIRELTKQPTSVAHQKGLAHQRAEGPEAQQQQKPEEAKSPEAAT